MFIEGLRWGDDTLGEMVYWRWHIIAERWFKEGWYIGRDGLWEDGTLGEMD